MNIFTKLFSGGAKEIVDSVGGVIDNLTTSKEEKEAAKLAMQQEINRHFESIQANATKELELELQDKANARGMQVEALKQTDLFSKRFVYYFTAIFAHTWCCASLGRLCDQRGALPKCVGLQAMREGMSYSVAACNS